MVRLGEFLPGVGGGVVAAQLGWEDRWPVV